MPARRFVHDEPGFSYRMSALQAACGLGQLEHVEAFLRHKQWMAAEYGRRLSGIAGLRLPVTRPWAGNVHWMYAIVVEEAFPLSRDGFCSALRERGVETRDFFASAARQPLLAGRVAAQGPFPVSEDAAARGLYLPSGLALTPAQLDHVCATIADVVAEVRR